VTDTLPYVVVPYADFLDRCERRRRIVAELRRQDAQPSIDAEAAVVAAAETALDRAEISVRGSGSSKKSRTGNITISIDDLR